MLDFLPFPSIRRLLNPEPKQEPRRNYTTIGIAQLPAIQRPIVRIPEIKSYNIWDQNVNHEQRIRNDFNSRLQANVVTSIKSIEDQLKENEEALHRKRLERMKVEQFDRYPAETRKADTIYPIHQVKSLKDRFFNSKFFDNKYFSYKPKRPELTKLHNEHINKVSQPHPPDEQLIELDGAPILRKDIQTLKGLNWLNDEIINAYMYLLVCRGKTNGRLRVHTFNTFFYPKLKDSGFNSIKRWTRRVDIFSHDIILVPVHLGNHWCLAVIDIANKKISYYDSLGGSAGPCCKILLDYLKDEMSDKKKLCFDKENWSIAEFKGGQGGVPRQENGSDCGVFACTYAEYITRPAKFDFTQRDMNYFRNKMIYEITKGSILE